MSRTPLNARRRVLAVAAGALATCLTAATAASAAVTLDWTQASVYEFAGPPTAPKTWLGYVTSPTTGGIGTNGAATASEGATGLQVTSSSPRGTTELYTFSYPATAGAIDADALEGTLEFDGAVTFHSPDPPAGHGFTISLEDPEVVLNGDGTGQLSASGVTSNPGGTYDESQPVFDLDLGNARWLLQADGTRRLVDIAPAIATPTWAFPGNYPTGAGPDRTPNTFGSFSISFTPDSGPSGQKGETGAAGPTGPAGPSGEKVTVIRRIQVAYLAKAPFGKGRKKIRISRKGKIVARGRIKGRTLRVRLTKNQPAKRRLKGRYVLRVVGSKRRALVRLG